MSKPSAFSLLHKDFDLDKFIHAALKEDTGGNDHTTLSCIPERAKGKSRLIIKENGILAGVALAQRIFKTFDRSLQVKVFLSDGRKVKKGDIAFTVEGNARSILTTERVVLNCMQRMSGIATATDLLTKKCGASRTRIMDTRKTTPGLRHLEKWAVRIGGGYNHRFGLYDMILIKNNHIDFSGGIPHAVEAARAYLKRKGMKLQIEVEARNIDEVKQALACGKIKRILLDNFSIPELKKAIRLIGRKAETEISGGINEKNIHRYASCGGDYISVGALTHSVKSLDMSLTAVKRV